MDLRQLTIKDREFRSLLIKKTGKAMRLAHSSFGKNIA